MLFPLTVLALILLLSQNVLSEKELREECDESKERCSWMVAITKNVNETGGDNSTKTVEKLVCTGVLVDKSIVLTPAHCFRKTNPSLYSAKIGSRNWRSGFPYEIRCIDVHYGYNEGTYRNNDIAIVFLQHSVNQSFITPMALPQKFMTRESVNKGGTTVVGWNDAAPSEKEDDDVLQMVENIATEDNTRCQTLIGNRKLKDQILPVGTKITNGMFCAGSKSLEGDDVGCTNDSWGPVLFYDGDGDWGVVGLRSFGNECGSSNSPGVYTWIRQYGPWLLKRTGSKEMEKQMKWW